MRFGSAHVAAAIAIVAFAAIDDLRADPSVGEQVTARVEYRNVTVPLPEGQWTVIGDVDMPHKDSAKFPMSQLILVSRLGGTIDRVVKVWVQRRPTNGYFTPFEPCTDDEYYVSTTASNNGDTLDCWHVRRLSLGLKGKSEPANKALVTYARENGVFLPLVMIGARFALLQSALRRFYVEYLWTPDLLLRTDDGGVWRPEDWSRVAVESDPAKSAVVGAVATWAEDWRARLDTP